MHRSLLICSFASLLLASLLPCCLLFMLKARHTRSKEGMKEETKRTRSNPDSTKSKKQGNKGANEQGSKQAIKQGSEEVKKQGSKETMKQGHGE